MDSIVRGLVVYGFLIVLFRIAGKRTLQQLTTFDLVLLLIISEATQQALLDDDNSMTNGFLVVITLVGLDILLSLVKQRWGAVEKALDGTPMIILEDGRPLEERMDKARVDISDILTAARERLGLERLEQIKYAVLERGGGISIIPREHP
jgi:uncharacterized membrane protein YcaP (DUF421 family)